MQVTLFFVVLMSLSLGNKNQRSTKDKTDIRIFNLYLIVDFDLNTEMQRKSLSNEERIESIINIVNKIYIPLHIKFRVVQIEIWMNPIIPNFSEYYLPYELKSYKLQLNRKYHDCLYMLVSSNGHIKRQGYGEPFSMCSRSSCVGYIVDSVNQNVSETAYVMAHELGHNFGLSHDTSNCGCISCVMATGIEISGRSLKWSRCSLTRMETILVYGYQNCELQNSSFNSTAVIYMNDKWSRSKSKIKNIVLNISHCGNGIVEDNEECDCLNNTECSKCCNMNLCHLKLTAKCASGTCCNAETCQVFKEGYICREAQDSCEISEFCNGINEFCGTNTYKLDGTECKTKYNESAFCFNGKCQNHLTQCRLLWGDSANVSNYECYQENNNNYHKFKNCGYLISEDNDKSKQCENGSEICGRLWCDHLNEKIMELGINELFSFTKNNNFCQAAKFELDWNGIDIGLVPNGASCGSNKMCYRGKCVKVQKKKCFCNGHGICDNLMNCHCEYGYVSPNCSKLAFKRFYTSILINQSTLNSTPSSFMRFYTSTFLPQSTLNSTQSYKSSQNKMILLWIMLGFLLFILFAIFSLYKITKILIKQHRFLIEPITFKNNREKGSNKLLSLLSKK